jgi:hypothetical protein
MYTGSLCFRQPVDRVSYRVHRLMRHCDDVIANVANADENVLHHCPARAQRHVALEEGDRLNAYAEGADRL